LFRAFLWAVLLIGLVWEPRRPSRWWIPPLLASELYLVALIGVYLLPASIDSRLFRQAGFLSIGFLTERLSAVLAVLFCCLLGSVKPQKWHIVGFSVIAVIFFGFLYRDTGKIDRAESQVEGLIHNNIPPLQRIVANLEIFPSTNVGSAHIIDRACIEKCFSYSNYEPGVAQFRVRAINGNPIVLTDAPTVLIGRSKFYVVQKSDLPLSEIRECDSGGGLCFRKLAAGDRTPWAFALDRSWIRRFNGASLLLDFLLASILGAGAFMLRRIHGQRISGGLSWSCSDGVTAGLVPRNSSVTLDHAKLGLGKVLPSLVGITRALKSQKRKSDHNS